MNLCFSLLRRLSSILIFIIIAGALNQLLGHHAYFGDPPVILLVPADTTINCLDDLPSGQSLQATDDDDPSFPKMISPTDVPENGSITSCSGGNILRIWEASDLEGNITRDTQVITVLPDNIGPIVTIPEVFDTVACDVAMDPLSSLNYVNWRSAQEVTIATNLGAGITDECSGLSGYSISPTTDFEEPCGTRILTFTISDQCGNEQIWSAYYTTIDTIAPTLTGIPNDTTISCSAGLPPPASVAVSDNCSNNLIANFSQTDNQILDGSCSEVAYQITRTWTANDGCGNFISESQIITLIDTLAPTFTAPPTTVISCTDDEDDLDLTGRILDATDDCNAELTITYSDQKLPGGCPNDTTILRTWQVIDPCGNLRTSIQFIEKRDQTPPTFDVPSDTLIDCSQAEQIDLTGRPTNIMDNCSAGAFEVDFSDVIIPDPLCEGKYVIRRTWMVTDSCGNTGSQDQMITVEDLFAPVFDQSPQNLVLDCTSELNISEAFDQWTASFGDAIISDNCSIDDQISKFVYEPGTDDIATLMAPSCPSSSDTILQQMVAFSAIDQCGNEKRDTAFFIVIDSTNPVIESCPSDTIIGTLPGQCAAEFNISAPLFREGCSGILDQQILTVNSPIVGNAPLEELGDTPVDPVTLNFAVNGALPINAFSSADLQINLINVDAEAAEEFFWIYGEDGGLIGRTANSASSCTDADTTLSISAFQIDEWAKDGVIEVRLVPNLPDGLGGRFAINDICSGGSMVNATLSFQSKDLSKHQFKYKVDEAAIVDGTFNSVTPITLEEGIHEVTYYIYDCVNRVDSCSFLVEIKDVEPPVFSCPNDTVLVLSEGTCQDTLALPFISVATDNCDNIGGFFAQLPLDTASAYWTYALDPNLNEYLAQPKSIVFDNVRANAVSKVILTITLKGDFDSNMAFVEIIDEQGNLLGQSTVGVASCSSEGVLEIELTADQFNELAKDSQFELQLVPKDITVPPGVSGDGINPCNPAAITQNGQTDSIGYAFVALSYEELSPSYFIEGATSVPLTPMSAPAFSPTTIFNRGVSNVFYTVSDLEGNTDTCSFSVEVQDLEAPTAICQSTTVFINPSGEDFQTIDAREIDGGSFDNCGIDTMFLDISTFSCNDAGSSVNVTLSVVDSSGNVSTCSRLIRIEAEAPEPTANSGLCGGDTLFLFANPPEAVGGVVFTYEWFNPDNVLISTKENPVLTNISGDDAGTYRVEITGITGCTSVGVVQVVIEDLPLTPNIISDEAYCTNESIMLESSVITEEPDGTYRWYEGTPGDNALIGITSIPRLTLPEPHATGERSFFLEIESSGCISRPSPVKTVEVLEIPVAVVQNEEITICSGENITLGTFVSGDDIFYQWTGPNGYAANEAFPAAIENATSINAGAYRLEVSNPGCTSTADITLVNVKQTPAQPEISSNGPLCEGEDLVLTASTPNAAIYKWTSPNLETFLTDENTFEVSEAQLSTGGQWRVAVTQFECESVPSDPLVVAINSNPNAIANATKQGVCSGEDLQLEGAPQIIGATYSWIGPAGFSSGLRNPIVSNVSDIQEGTFTFTVTTPEGCTDSDDIEIEVLEGVNITGVSNDATRCLSGPTDIKLVATVFPISGTRYNYNWEGPNGYVSTDIVAVIPNATSAQNGNYALFVQNENGCISNTVTTTVDVMDPPQVPVKPFLSDATPGPICVGDSAILETTIYNTNDVTYVWQGPFGTIESQEPTFKIPTATISDNGLYSVTAIVDGCPSRASSRFNFSVNNIPVITASSNSPVCSGEMISLSATPLDGASYSWFGPSEFSSSKMQPEIQQADTSRHNGAYQVVATLNGCRSAPVSVAVEVLQTPRTPVVEAEMTAICIDSPGDILRLNISPGSATEGAVYTWYDPFGLVAEDVAATNIGIKDYSGYEEGVFDFSVQAASQGCLSNLSEPISISFNDIPNNNAFAGEDQEVCIENQIELFATAPNRGTGTWTQVGGNETGVVIANPENANTPVEGLNANQSYLFRWTISNGACKDYSSDDVLVKVVSAEAPDAGASMLVCFGEIVNLNAKAPENGTGRWSQSRGQSGLGVVIEDPNSPNSLISGLEPDNLYEFIWTISGSCGDFTDEVTVRVSDPGPDAGQDQLVCNEDGTTVLSGAAPLAGSNGAWSAIEPGPIFDNASDPMTEVFNLAIGNQAFVWTIDEGFCGELSVDTVEVAYYEPPVANDDAIEIDFGDAKTFSVLENDEYLRAVTISIIDNPMNGTVEILDSLQVRYIPDLNVVGTDQFTYELCSEGCECSLATVFINIGSDASCDAPNIITPNNDGVNDQFVIPCLLNINQYPNSQLYVFNRWGDEVYRSTQPYQNNWIGTYNGEDLPVGTYYYVLEFGGDRLPVKGFVEIYR